MRVARFVPVVLLAFMVGASALPQLSVKADTVPIGWIVRDVTDRSDCIIHGEAFTSIDPASNVVEQWEEACPPGSVLETAAVYSTNEMKPDEGLFVSYTGNMELDEKALQETKAVLMPPEPQEPENLLGSCTEGGWSKSASFFANEPGLTVLYKAFYWQDSSCSSGVSRTEIMISPSGQQRFAKSLYYGQQAHHGCAQLTTYYVSHPVYIYAPLGYLFTNETRSGALWECETAWGTSYTGSVYLTIP